MTDQYAKGCEIEPIIPLIVSPATEIFAKSVITQMSILCIDHITEQLSKSYTEKYKVFMTGCDRDSLRALAVNKFAEYLSAESESIKALHSVESMSDVATKISS